MATTRRKYTKARVKRIIDALVEGLGRRAAARLAGVHYATFTNWLAEEADFARQVWEAEARFEKACLDEIVGIAFGVGEFDKSKGPRVATRLNALKFLLERRCSHTWSHRREIDFSGPVPVRVTGDVGLMFNDEALRALTPEQLAAAIRAKYGEPPTPQGGQ